MTYRERLEYLTGQLRDAKNYALGITTSPITYEVARDLTEMIDKINLDIRRAQQLQDKES